MAKTRKAKEISPELAAQFAGFTPAAEKLEDEQPGVLDELLGAAGGVDETDGKELSVDDGATLAVEFDGIVALTQRKLRLEAELKRINAELKAQKFSMIDAMELQGTKQFKGIAGPESCSITERYDTKVVDRAAFMDWVQEHAPETLTVNSQTRNSFIRNNYTNKGVAPGDDTFPAGIEVTPVKGLTVRGAKKPDGKQGK